MYLETRNPRMYEDFLFPLDESDDKFVTFEKLYMF